MLNSRTAEELSQDSRGFNLVIRSIESDRESVGMSRTGCSGGKGFEGSERRVSQLVRSTSLLKVSMQNKVMKWQATGLQV